mmetsp:Transcript_1996/g.2177  ORF Transcript_1996/g.2177 Transcript_1996/m.2177 type:complete len:125 (-) Transcript_1996:70-444(-)
MLGNGRCDVQCVDGVKRLCHIRGKMRKKVWCNQGDIVLVSLRDFQDEKGDIIVKYTAEEARSLKNYGELPENVKINETDIGDGDSSSFLLFSVLAFARLALFPPSLFFGIRAANLNVWSDTLCQ